MFKKKEVPVSFPPSNADSHTFGVKATLPKAFLLAQGYPPYEEDVDGHLEMDFMTFQQARIFALGLEGSHYIDVHVTQDVETRIRV